MALVNRIRSLFGDPVLGLTVLFLTLFGIAMIYSAGQLDVPDRAVARVWRMQFVWLGLSLVILLIVMRIQVRWFEWAALPAYILSILLLAAVLVIGTGKGTAKGTHQWIGLGPVGFQ